MLTCISSIFKFIPLYVQICIHTFLTFHEITTNRFPNARDFPFNNVATAFVTLFELLTLEGWTEVRDMFSDRNSKAEAVSETVCTHDDVHTKDAWYMHLFYAEMCISVKYLLDNYVYLVKNHKLFPLKPVVSNYLHE